MQFVGHPFPFRGVQTVDKKDPIQVIDLVLQGTGQEALGLEFNLVSFEIDSTDPHHRRPLHLAVHTRDTQTGFAAGLWRPDQIGRAHV